MKWRSATPSGGLQRQHCGAATAATAEEAALPSPDFKQIVQAQPLSRRRHAVPPQPVHPCMARSFDPRPAPPAPASHLARARRVDVACPYSYPYP